MDVFADNKAKVRFRLRGGSAALWASRNPVLMADEPGFETDTGVFKIGDGVTPWNDLPGYVDADGVQTLVEEVVAGAGGVTVAELLAHINSEAPHPVYDDGADFVLLYENAKVGT